MYQDSLLAHPSSRKAQTEQISWPDAHVNHYTSTPHYPNANLGMFNMFGHGQTRAPHKWGAHRPEIFALLPDILWCTFTWCGMTLSGLQKAFKFRKLHLKSGNSSKNCVCMVVTRNLCQVFVHLCQNIYVRARGPHFPEQTVNRV